MAQDANANEGNVLGFLTQEDQLDGTNYSLWSFMVRNLLIAKNLWEYVMGDEQRPLNVAPTTPSQGAPVGRTCGSYSRPKEMGFMRCTSSLLNCTFS